MLKLRLLQRREHQEDSERIKELANKHGANINIVDAEKVWLTWSEGMAAGWMGLPEDDEELWFTISMYFEDGND